MGKVFSKDVSWSCSWNPLQNGSLMIFLLSPIIRSCINDDPVVNQRHHRVETSFDHLAFIFDNHVQADLLIDSDGALRLLLAAVPLKSLSGVLFLKWKYEREKTTVKRKIAHRNMNLSSFLVDQSIRIGKIMQHGPTL